MDMNTGKENEFFIQIKGVGFAALIDKSLNKPAMLGRESFNRIIKTVMKHKAET
ncbi:hypothetical protein PvtlMGM2_2309 [Prevotella sp. MGM2]|nr:hypothetical protein PvtlMGM2_2309 [Prevotella sp. MGM2]